MKKIIQITCILSILILPVISLSADPVITASINDELFEVGDIVIVKINITHNPGFHGVYFDLAYDSSILGFEGISEGLMVRRENRNTEFLWAASDPVISAVEGSHVILTYMMTAEDDMTLENGNLAEIRFRLISSGVPETPYNFSFNDYGIEDSLGQELTGAVWQDSPDFYIGSGISGAYITIHQPYGNEVFFTDEAEVQATCFTGTGLTALLRNLTTGYVSDPIPADSGSIDNEMVPLDFYFNTIAAELYDQYGVLLAEDTVVVYRSEDDKYVKIISPPDHALVNSDMIRVRIASSYANVKVNGRLAEPLGETLLDHEIYLSDTIWLRSGFNTITAEAASPEEAVYTDTITVFYQKDESVFRFVQPFAGEILKPGENALQITGEIGGSGHNTVTLDVIYRPDNPVYNTQYLLNDQPAIVSETNIDPADSRVPYMFTYPHPYHSKVTGQGK